jgi:hypothetical protein
VKLYEIHEVYGTFELRRTDVDEDELDAHYPRRALSAAEMFTPVDESDN